MYLVVKNQSKFGIIFPCITIETLTFLAGNMMKSGASNVIYTNKVLWISIDDYCWSFEKMSESPEKENL